MNKEYFVYIIKSVKDGKFYTGMTVDLDRRLDEHNHGKQSTPSTLGRGPFILVHVEIVNDIRGARVLEKFFKSGWGREIREEIINSWWM